MVLIVFEPICIQFTTKVIDTYLKPHLFHQWDLNFELEKQRKISGVVLSLSASVRVATKAGKEIARKTKRILQFSVWLMVDHWQTPNEKNSY